jgi:serine/threonine protein kinase
MPRRNTAGAEVRILASIHHPHCVSFIGLSISPRGHMVIVTELCDTDLMTLLLKSPAHRGCNNIGIMVSMARQIASAASFLHSRGVIHRGTRGCSTGGGTSHLHALM